MLFAVIFARESAVRSRPTGRTPRSGWALMQVTPEAGTGYLQSASAAPMTYDFKRLRSDIAV